MAADMRMPTHVRSVEVKQLIVVKSATGAGTAIDPVRVVTEIYAMDGERLAISDDFASEELRSERDAALAKLRECEAAELHIGA